MLQVHRLEGFYWVAKTGGYAKAARAFPYPITQPGVFAQVRKLESDVGKRLFDRVAKDEMVMTRAGRQLFAFCSPFFEGLPALERSMRSGEARGELRIDAGALEMQEILPAWVKRIRVKHPDIRIRLHEIDSLDPSRILRGATDLVVEHQPELAAGLDGRVVGTHYVYFAAPATHPLVKRAARTALRPRDIAGEAFIAFDPASPEYALQIGAIARAGADVDVVATASTARGILALVGSGLGVSVVPWPSEDPPRIPGVVLVRQKGMALPIVASFRKTAEPDPLLEAAFACVPAPP